MIYKAFKQQHKKDPCFDIDKYIYIKYFFDTILYYYLLNQSYCW